MDSAILRINLYPEDSAIHLLSNKDHYAFVQRIEAFSVITFNSPFHTVECYNFAIFNYISN